MRDEEEGVRDEEEGVKKVSLPISRITRCLCKKPICDM